jgi:predicted SAM-dependent methyltransferase
MFWNKLKIKDRSELKKYLSGDGIEIGALHNPLDIKDLNISRIRYVDRISTKICREHYPELNQQNLTMPDIIDDAETLTKIEDDSLDFIIGNHLIEHLSNPIKALLTWSHKLKNNGIVFLAVPNMEKSFDKDRQITTQAHICKDFDSTNEERVISDYQHYLDWAKNVQHLKSDFEIEKSARGLSDMQYAIHFHTFTYESIEALLKNLIKNTRLMIKERAVNSSGGEFIFIPDFGNVMNFSSNLTNYKYFVSI